MSDIENTGGIPDAIASLATLNSHNYRRILQQVEKDFNLCGLQADWTEETMPDEFWITLVQAIHDLLETDALTLRALLYRVDVPEEMIEKLYLEKRPTLQEDLTKLLLFREIKKVLGRSSS